MRNKILVILLSAVVFLSGCATIYNPATERNEYIFIDDTTEVQLGRNVAKQLTKKEKLLRDAVSQARVEEVGRRIASVSDRTNINYEFYILDDKELNAMSLPGGIVYINKGLLDKLNDDELAFVLGHEVGHVAAKHAVKNIQSGMAFQLILTAASRAVGDNVTIAADQVYSLISLGYSRKDEYLADRLGVKYAIRAGFDPYAGISALEKIKGSEGPNIKVLEYTRSHPYIDERIKVLKDLIPQLLIQIGRHKSAALDYRD